MADHTPSDKLKYEEIPTRVTSIMSYLRQRGVTNKCVLIEGRIATDAEILQVHQ